MAYVLAAYGLVAAVLGLYGARLARERRALRRALGKAPDARTSSRATSGES
jgi:hypothetical protein